MIFRIILFLSIFFSALNFSYASEIIYTNPVWGDMLYRPAIFGPQANDLTFRIFNNTQNATQFCLQNGWTYVSHDGAAITTWQYLYFSNSWIKTTVNNVLTTVVCDIPEPEIQTIIDSDPWINKSVFDEETIRAIYLIEVIIIFFFFFFRFFARLIE